MTVDESRLAIVWENEDYWRGIGCQILIKNTFNKVDANETSTRKIARGIQNAEISAVKKLQKVQPNSVINCDKSGKSPYFFLLFWQWFLRVTIKDSAIFLYFLDLVLKIML